MTKAIDFGKDSVEAPPSKDKLTRVTELAREQVKCQKTVTKLEGLLKLAEAALRRVEEGELPNLMDEVGITELKLGKGWQLAITRKYSVKPAEKNRQKVVDWMEKKGFSGIVKREFVISFGKEDEAWVRKFEGDLKKRKKQLDTVRNRRIESATLRKHVLEMLEEGISVPRKLFGIFERRVAIVTPPKP